MYGVATTLRPDKKSYSVRLDGVKFALRESGQTVGNPAEVEVAAPADTGVNGDDQPIDFDALKKFYFLIIPLARGGSRILSSHLTMHPELFIPARGAVDSALRERREGELLRDHQALFKCFGFRRTGLVLHDYLSDGSGADVPERVARLIGGGELIMSVRDPLHMVRAHFNHHVVAMNSNYDFTKMGIGWIDDGTELTEMMSGEWRPPATGALAELPEMGMDFVKSRLRLGLRYHTVEQMFLEHFESVETVDVTELARNRDAELGRLYGILGVAGGFSHPYFDIPLANPPDCVMQYNPFRLDLFGHIVRFRIAYQGFSRVIPEYEDLIEVAEISPNEAFEEIGIANHNLCLGASPMDWLSLPRTLRLKIIDEGILQSVFERIVFPHWVKCFKIFREYHRPYRWEGEMPEIYLPVVRDFLAREVELFLVDHPRHERLWPNLKRLLGT